MRSADGVHRQAKDIIVEKVKRRPIAEAIASALDATNGNREPAPQTATVEDGQESHGRVHDVKIDGDRTVESKGSEFSPGKDPSLSVANYVSQIGQNWQRGVDAFMTVARLCAEASARLTITQRGELLKQLPFGDSAFSKFVQIGNDRRLNTPELRRLLPPHYTITYALTLLTDQELQDAIAAKVIHPDMNRDELQRWRNSHRKRPMKVGSAPSPKEAASDSTVAGAPIASTQDAAEQKAAGELAKLKAGLAKNKGTVESLEAKIADQRQRPRELKDAPAADYHDIDISITSPLTAPSPDQDMATNPPLDVELLIERHNAEVEGLQQKIRELEHELSAARQSASSPLIEAAGPATDSGDLTIPLFLVRRALSEDEQRQADDLERAFANAGALVRQRFWAKYAPGSASTTPGADEALAILAAAKGTSS